MDSRFRGNDVHGVIFGGAAGDEESRSAPKNIQSKIPRCARNDGLDEVRAQTLQGIAYNIRSVLPSHAWSQFSNIRRA